MGTEVTKIKSRIKSVTGALKVTSAMKLISTVKLNKWKGKMLAFRSYTDYVSSISDEVFGYVKNFESPLFNKNVTSNKNLFIIVSSTLGLCGSYNANIFSLAEASISKDDDAIILGNKGIAHFKDGEFTQINDFSNYSSIDDSLIIKNLTDFVINNFIKGTYKEVHLIYSKYINSLVFKPTDFVLLPLAKKEEQIKVKPILEPSEKELIDVLVPLYLKNIIYSKLLESEVSEQAARCNAMENATDNANELLNDLQIEFNKARQSAITQEIIEVVSASKAI